MSAEERVRGSQRYHSPAKVKVDSLVDSELAKESNIDGVQEMLNGCLCCTLVGRMADALLELKGKSFIPCKISRAEKYNPARIIVETSGSAFPAPIAVQIRQLTRENKGVHLDSIITVVDCIHFRGYEVPPPHSQSKSEDTSYTAKLQAKYTDVILMNKHELVTEREYEECLDHVYTLNEDTPVLKTYEQTDIAVDPDVVFGLDTRLFAELKEAKYMIDGVDHHHHSREIDLIHLERRDSAEMDKGKLEGILEDCLPTEVYRIKGFVRIGGQGMCILNFAFGRWELTPLSRPVKEGESRLRLTVMLARGEGRQWKREFEKRFEGDNISVDFYPA